jgi:hypothetical protein
VLVEIYSNTFSNTVPFIQGYRQIIKELGEQKSKVEGLEDQLKVSEKKQLESDNEIKLLKKQFEEFKMLLNPDAKDKVNTKQKDIDEMSDTDSSTTGDWVKTDTIKDEEADQEKS